MPQTTLGEVRGGLGGGYCISDIFTCTTVLSHFGGGPVPFLWMVHAGGVSGSGIHLSRPRTTVSL